MASPTTSSPPPYTTSQTTKQGTELPDTNLHLPPTPPKSLINSEDNSTSSPSDSPSTSRRPSSSLQQYLLPPPSSPPTQILPLDLKTPDSHVPRDPRLIRLTGIHPFNVEAPLSALYNEGFLTSPELFYVRNHGAVPQVQESDIPDWEFSVEGLVKTPLKITLRELMEEYEQITVPITLVCAGNRRKEQNMVRKSKGFSWGAAGVSTALWTGVPLFEVLKRAGILRGGKYVCMEGADKLPNGYYGTSVKTNWAMDPNRGIMLAYKMNGEMLRPDHGKPLRVVVPGQIGGRSVKWLKKLTITEGPSENWYHIYDNRVLPTMVSPEMSAEDPKWWMDERYAIYDLSTNSATAFPAHEERVSIQNPEEKYKVRGYAYGGGGRRVTRVEITLDKGRTWKLANIHYHEDEYRKNTDEDEMLYGGKLDMEWRETSFCWCFWELELQVGELMGKGDIMVRAMDESMNVQPRDMYWSVLGMMNNPWYRITIALDSETQTLKFEHPTQPALMPGGWMERVKKAGGDLANGFWGEKMGGEGEGEVVMVKKEEIKMTREGVERMVTIDELRKHDGDREPWFVVNGEVYDGTAFLEGHPGGATSILGAAGQDASDEFMAIHSETAKAMMTKYHIGSLDEASRSILAEGDSAPESTEQKATFLNPKSWTKALLTSKKIISSDTRIFTFSLQYSLQTLGLPTGQHLMMKLKDSVNGESIIRSYTPISAPETKGVVEVLVKVYFDTKEREGGKMTRVLDKLPINEFVEFKGPIGKFEYFGKGNCSVGGKQRQVRKFHMICAGSGITPIFQVLRKVLQDSEDSTKVLVLDGNREEADILCREEMDELVQGKENKCKLVYTLSKPTEGWKGGRGRLGEELLEREVGRWVGGEKEDGDGEGGEMVLICGPEALEKSVHGILNGLGWRDEDLLFF